MSHQLRACWHNRHPAVFTQNSQNDAFLVSQPIKNQFLVLVLHLPDAKCLIRPLCRASQVWFTPPHLHKSLAQIILSPHFAGGSICDAQQSGFFTSIHSTAALLYVWTFYCDRGQSLPPILFDQFLLMRKVFNSPLYSSCSKKKCTFAGCQWY